MHLPLTRHVAQSPRWTEQCGGIGPQYQPAPHAAAPAVLPLDDRWQRTGSPVASGDGHLVSVPSAMSGFTLNLGRLNGFERHRKTGVRQPRGEKSHSAKRISKKSGALHMP